MKSRLPLRSVFAALTPLTLLALVSVSAFAGSVVPTASLDHGMIIAGEDNTLYVLVDFDVARFKAPPDVGRPDLNLALVLDRSGSMEDRGKIAYARDAAMIVVDKMHADDVLAVVEYDDMINVLWPASRVESKGLIKRRIADLTPRGSTDLCGGLMRGADEALRHRDGSDINRVILLSDGLANHGVTEPREIYRLVREAKRRGISVSTMGLGLDYNEDLMQGIAEYGGGNYYYIEHPRQMSGIFARELNTLFTTVARDVVIRYRAADKVNDVEVFGYGFDIDGHDVTVPLENFHAEETRSLLMKLELDPARTGELDLGEITLTYHDQLADETVEIGLDLSVDVSDDAEAVTRSRDEHVVVEATLTDAEKRQDELVRLYEQGDLDAAQAGLSDLADRIGTLQTSVDSPKLAAKLEALSIERMDMVAAESNASDRSAYVKQGKARAYLGGRGKRAYFMMSEGDKGPEVEALQQALVDLDLYDGAVDGVFSLEVKTAVEAFQRLNSLDDDGVAGPSTLRALDLY